MRHRVVRALPWVFVVACLVVAGAAIQSGDQRDERADRRERASALREKRLVDQVAALHGDIDDLTELVGSLGGKLDIANAEITRLGGIPVPSGIPVAPAPPPTPTADPSSPPVSTSPPATSPTTRPRSSPPTTRPCVVARNPLRGDCIL